MNMGSKPGGKWWCRPIFHGHIAAMETGSIEIGAAQVGHYPHRIADFAEVKSAPVHQGAADICAVQIRALPVGIGQIRRPQVNFNSSGLTAISASEICAEKEARFSRDQRNTAPVMSDCLRSAQKRFTLQRLAPLMLAADRVAPPSSAPVKSAERRSVRAGWFVEPGVGEVCATQVCAAQHRLAKIQSVQVRFPQIQLVSGFSSRQALRTFVPARTISRCSEIAIPAG